MRISDWSSDVCSPIFWDDHDICDGWGSLPPERMDSPFGRAVFAVARELYLLFQQGAVAPDYPPAFGDRSGTSLGWHLRLPGLDVVAPDLRSERRRSEEHTFELQSLMRISDAGFCLTKKTYQHQNMI